MAQGLMRGFGFERRWLVAAFELLIPSQADPHAALGARDAPMARYVDELLDVAPLKFVTGVRACLFLLWTAPLWMSARFASFWSLTHGEQLGLLDRLRASDVYVLRELPLLLKTIGCLGFCGLPEVQAQLDISPRDATPPSWARRGTLPLAGRRP